MIGVKVRESGENVLISWQFSKVKIPINEIKEVISDDTYGGEERKAMRIGFPYATTERIVIKTTKEDYILYTNNTSVKNKIEQFIT
ncbi:hypothetical protein H0266_15135 [Halobacillus locisalis]|uniref:Sublancin immunity protein SunI-like PH domain-containing protein n=1 Tax=Halobacillus locisalis TaxID=220753 RepID=A0A838CW89_9BACI|nr:hypothetical protein [Halobacillus locisalis]MBA2176230.1 hypothetical protein [Halobacillus locisalis]